MSLGTYRPDIEKWVKPEWAATEQYLERMFLKPDDALDAAYQSHKTEDIPAINVPPLNGQLLFNLALAKGTEKPLDILEVGTLAGYSTIWLAKAAKLSGGKVTTLEYEPRHAEVARRNIERAGLSDQVEILVGDAHLNLPKLVEDGRSFGMVFIDADKPGYCDYLEKALMMSKPGTLIVADNVIRQGKIADASNTEENVEGVRKFLAMAAQDARIATSPVQTVNEKGWDGFTISVVL